jgi:PAS domain S-box-containing protein
MAAVHPSQDTDERLRELRAAQARLRALIDNEPECVKLLDAEGRLLEMNAAGLRMIEADAGEQVLGKCVYGIVAPEHVEAFRDLTERVCRGERATLEFELVGLKGARRWMETHAAPFRDEASGETRLLAITRDITDRRRAEQALRESEQRFQLFMDNLPASAWIRDAQFRYTYANRLYAKTWGGLEPLALVGRDATELFPPEVAQYFRDTDDKVREQGAPIQFVDCLPSGRWLKVKFPLPDGAVAGVALDITDRARLEEALRESERRFRSFMDNAPAVAWIKDANFRYTFVNRTHHRVFGRGEEMLGRDDFEIHPESVARELRQHDEAALRAGGGASQTEETVLYSDHTPGRWLVVKFPLADASGKTGVAGIAVDITERTRLEEKARQYAEDVRNLVNRLVQAQEAERRRVADELHDLIGQNLTALGIELQTLKHRLQSGGDLIAGPRIDAMAALVETTIDAIRGVMTDLKPAVLEDFGLVPALRWYASLFGKRTGMKVSASVSGSELRLPRDIELALFRIAQEALTNAAKHSGGTAVDIAVRYGEGLRLTVEDDGRGFAEPLGARGARRGGFGLPTMRERAEAHGGTLRIEFPGRGTRLVVDMPTPSHAD